MGKKENKFADNIVNSKCSYFPICNIKNYYSSIIIIILLFFSLLTFIYAQSSDLSSLESELNNLTEELNVQGFDWQGNNGGEDE